MNYDKHTLEILFSTGLFYKDTAGHMDVADPEGDNKGLTKRATFTNTSNVVELLHLSTVIYYFKKK